MSGRTEFAYDGAEPIADYDGDRYRDGDLTARPVIRQYVNGAGVDERLMHVGPSGAVSYYHTDHQGSIIAWSQSIDGNSLETYTYDAYGNVGQGEGSGSPFRFTGRRYDVETGLYFYRARYYSSKLGRFLQTDPIGYADNMNLYGYTGNDPVNYIDPTGLMGTSSGSGSVFYIPRPCPPDTVFVRVDENGVTICELRGGSDSEGLSHLLLHIRSLLENFNRSQTRVSGSSSGGSSSGSNTGSNLGNNDNSSCTPASPFSGSLAGIANIRLDSTIPALRRDGFAQNLESGLRLFFGTSRGAAAISNITALNRPLEVRGTNFDPRNGRAIANEYRIQIPRTRLASNGYGRSVNSVNRLAITISHEVGHAIFNVLDDGPNRMNNVIAHENPVRAELCSPLRTEY